MQNQEQIRPKKGNYRSQLAYTSLPRVLAISAVPGQRSPAALRNLCINLNELPDTLPRRPRRRLTLIAPFIGLYALKKMYKNSSGEITNKSLTKMIRGLKEA